MMRVTTLVLIIFGDDSASVPPMEMGNMVAFFGEGEEMDEEMAKAASVTLN